MVRRRSTPSGNSLDDLPIGATGRVSSLPDTPVGTRLRAIGFVPGTPVVAERRTPFGGPVVYSVRSTKFALRRCHAALVQIER